MLKSWRSFAVVLVPSCLLAYWVGSNLLPPPQRDGENSATPQVTSIAGLSIDPVALDLGEVWEEKIAICKIPITNKTSAPIEIMSFAASCGCCTAIEPRQLTISAGQTAEVRVHLDTTHRGASDMGLPRRPLVVEVTPSIRNLDPSRPGWVVRGIVNSRVTLNVLNVHFGDSPVQGQTPVRRKVVATAHVPLDRLEANVDPALAAVQVVPHGSDKKQFDLLIAPRADLAPGSLEANVTLHAV